MHGPSGGVRGGWAGALLAPPAPGRPVAAPGVHPAPRGLGRGAGGAFRVRRGRDVSCLRQEYVRAASRRLRTRRPGCGAPPLGRRLLVLEHLARRPPSTEEPTSAP